MTGRPLIKRMKEIVQEHFKEAEKSLIGIGQYIIRPEYEHLRVSSSKWFMLNDNQKQTLLQRFHHALVEDMTTSGIGPSSSVLTLLPINHFDNGDVASLPLPFSTSN